MIHRMGAIGLLAVLCLTCTTTLFVPAIQHTSVANAMTILAAVPFFTAAVSWIWLRERPSVRTVLEKTDRSLRAHRRHA
jgi:drug/metabolite transporter (DMT)-like permease